MKMSVAYLTMLCCYVYYVDDSKKQNNDDVQHIQANTYDAIGNPKKYFGSDLEWDYGRRLRKFYSGLYDTTYSYNADGMLIKQAVTYNTIPDYPINYSYENFYDGTMLIRRTGQGFDAWFDYDESGSPVGMNVTTTTGNASNPTVTTAQYYFIKNLQGDIVAMTDATGTIKCSYTYDSWGKVLSIAGPNGTPSLTDYTNPANINPFRYRGYYYDAENQLYWLRSRFYDPNTGRFLNADGYVSTGQGLLSTNMFLYCLNNPIRYIDESGGRCDENGPRSPWVMVTPTGRVVTSGLPEKPSTAKKLVEDFNNFDINNEDPEAVFSSNYFAGYKGKLVIKTPLAGAFSFGAIGLGTKSLDVNSLNHEYGHCLQMDRMGVISFTKNVAIPSVLIYWIDCQGKLPYDYYSYPWEAEANLLGGSTLSDDSFPKLPAGECPSTWDLVQMLLN